MKKLLLSILIFLTFTSIAYASGHHEHAHIGGELDSNLISYYLHDVSEGSSFSFWVLMMVTFIFGALHSLAPGHGNILIASYFTSREAKISHGIIMAVIIAVVHVISAIAIVMGTDVLTKHLVYEGCLENVNIAEIVSYFSIFVIGLFMLVMTYRDKGHCLCCGHNHEPTISKNKSYWLLAVSIGLVPCASSLLVLFLALSENMLMLGIYMVMSMSVGIGLTLAIIGVASIIAHKKIIINKDSNHNSRLIIYMRYFASIVILLFGLLSLIDALMEM